MPVQYEEIVETSSDQASGAANLDQAARACDFPIVVWEPGEGSLILANPPAADLLGLPLEEMAGQQVLDIVSPRHFVQIVAGALGTMAADSVQADRRITRADGRSVPVRIWSRAIQVNGLLTVVSLVVPMSELGRLGRDPAAPWRDLAPIAVGIVDEHWRVQSISRDVRAISGMEPSEYVGASMRSFVHPDDAEALTDSWEPPGSTVAACSRTRIRHRDGRWVSLCLLFGPLAGGPTRRYAVALMTAPEHDAVWLESRVSDLERRLRHIGAEVRASGVLDALGSLPAASDAPAIAELSSRQWEILSRLVRGDRVATIASDLYLSQSTVRNHLSVVFKKFGVHSQAELLATLRAAGQGGSGLGG